MSHTLLARADTAAGLWTTPLRGLPELEERENGQAGQDAAVVVGVPGAAEFAQDAADVFPGSSLGDPRPAAHARVRAALRHQGRDPARPGTEVGHGSSRRLAANSPATSDGSPQGPVGGWCWWCWWLAWSLSMAWTARPSAALTGARSRTIFARARQGAGAVRAAGRVRLGLVSAPCPRRGRHRATPPATAGSTFLQKSGLSARAIREVLGDEGTTRTGPREPIASRPGVRGCWASGVVGTWSTRFNAGELGAVNDGVRM